MKCTKCNIFEVDTEIYLREKRKTCRGCYNLRSYKSRLKKRYGITKEQYDACMASSTVCEICSSPNYLCYDHDHITMDFRGVLCRSCNRAIGILGDTKESLEKALNYLKD